MGPGLDPDILAGVVGKLKTTLNNRRTKFVILQGSKGTKESYFSITAAESECSETQTGYKYQPSSAKKRYFVH